MAAPGEFDIEYVDARRVLLDALVAIGPQIGAVTLIGAQAVYSSVAMVCCCNRSANAIRLASVPPSGRSE